MSEVSASSRRGTLGRLALEAWWWLRALVGAPATFRRFALLTGLALLVASVPATPGRLS